MLTTPAKRNKMTQTEHVAAIEEHLNIKQLRQKTLKFKNLEIEVHQDMAVMDEQTGRLIKYKQVMRDSKYKKKWSTSSANEFGRLANGVGNCIKNPTNTIKFIK